MNASTRLLLLMVLVLSVVGAITTCPPSPQLVSTPHPGRPECPHDWDFKQGQLPAVAEISDIPEFNDCQRFIVYENDEAHYDELYAIFAVLDLDSIADSLANHDPTSPDTLSVAVAEIYAEGRYQPLGISSMFSCLIVRRHGSEWNARMVPVADAYVDCRAVQPDSGKTLRVNRVPVRVTPPPVARWDWSDRERDQYIVIPCGPFTWCEIGDEDLPQTPTPTPRGRPATRYVKGWYDQQYLATISQGQTVPTRIVGFIFPDPELDGLEDTTDFQPDWVRVAEVAFEVPESPTQVDQQAVNNYKISLNFDPTRSGAWQEEEAKLNTIYLQYGDAATVFPTLLSPQNQQRLATCPQAKWWAMIVSAVTADTVYNCVVFRGHPIGFHIPGTTRWRWLASDETTWERCTQGCCELPGGLIP